MAKFKLTPIAAHRDDRAWQLSTVLGVVYAGAISAAEARELAGRYFAQTGKVDPDTPIPAGSPWLNPDLTECEAIAEFGPDRIPHGYVYAAD
jgi:hypothetical protein